MNTEYNTAASSSSSALFPPLNDATSSPHLDDLNNEGGLLWNNVNTFAIPDDNTERSDTSSTSSPFSSLRFNSHATTSLTGATTTTATTTATMTGVDAKENSTAFNISWGGDDKPPSEVHPQVEEVEEPKLSRPLPKPRGIRKLPEPEPSADGTIDEDTLKRRKNTDAARRSRMKKIMKVEQLETKVNALQAENAKLTLSNAVLESEKRSLYAKENEYKKRIKYLEDIMRCHGWDFNNSNSNHDQW